MARHWRTINTLVIASVPHTGSHFLHQLTGARIWHTYPGESMDAIRAADVVISPLRHPMSVALSWRNRGKPIIESDRHTPMVQMWRNLLSLDVDHFVPLDTPERDFWLRSLSEAMGIPLVTDWAKVGHFQGCSTLTEDETAAVHELLPFFERFYGPT